MCPQNTNLKPLQKTVKRAFSDVFTGLIVLLVVLGFQIVGLIWYFNRRFEDADVRVNLESKRITEKLQFVIDAQAAILRNQTRRATVCEQGRESRLETKFAAKDEELPVQESIEQVLSRLETLTGKVSAKSEQTPTTRYIVVEKISR